MSPKLITDSNFEDFLIYGTSMGELKIRKFPYMEEIKKFKVNENSKSKHLSINDSNIIKCIDVTNDLKFAYLWQKNENDISLVKDQSVTSEAATVNLINMGFGF